METKRKDQRFNVLASEIVPGRHIVYVDIHVIGVLRSDKNGCEILRVKTGRAADGRGIYEQPCKDRRSQFPTIGEAAEELFVEWQAVFQCDDERATA